MIAMTTRTLPDMAKKGDKKALKISLVKNKESSPQKNHASMPREVLLFICLKAVTFDLRLCL